MNKSNLIQDPPYSASSIKEYLVSTDDYFDRVELLNADNKQIEVRLQRYAPDGQAFGPDHNVAVFPFAEDGNSFMLVRSQDRSRILLLGFESVESNTPRLHALLFDQDWRLLSNRVYRHPHLSQPMIQDDFSAYPLEDFNGGPLKLANNGEWLMLAPSRRPIGTEHDRIGAPLMCTVQAPHWAMPQPNFVPVRPTASRKAQSSGVSGSRSI